MKTTTRKPQQKKHSQQPQTPVFSLKIPTGIEGKSIWATVALARHEYKDDRQKTVSTNTLPLLEVSKDGKSAFLGSQPMSEFVTVPYVGPDRSRKGQTFKRFHTSYQLTIDVPADLNFDVSRKDFYGKQEMTQVRGSYSPDGQWVRFFRNIPLVNAGTTAVSRIEANESKNNLYVTIEIDTNTFKTIAVAVVNDPDNGLVLVTSETYEADIFRVGEKGLECPFLDDPIGPGRSAGSLVPIVGSLFPPEVRMTIPEKPADYSYEIPLNLRALKRGVTPKGAKWAWVYVNKDSIARGLSFGIMKGTGDSAGKQDFVYINWFDDQETHSGVGSKIRRVPVGSVLRGVLEDRGGRTYLARYTSLTAEETREVVESITDPEIIAKFGKSAVQVDPHQHVVGTDKDPAWVKKIRQRASQTNSMAHAFLAALEAREVEKKKSTEPQPMPTK